MHLHLWSLQVNGPVKDNDKEREPADDEREPRQENDGDERSYTKYANEGAGFDPFKDLNLPKNYEEVVRRFEKLQGERAMELLN
ncbi:MAG: hypothetical protein H6594_07535 [Flavobacteriales bacterium]|nr:hypothetical protein [Flavobacteriales bacterium]